MSAQQEINAACNGDPRPLTLTFSVANEDLARLQEALNEELKVSSSEAQRLEQELSRLRGQQDTLIQQVSLQIYQNSCQQC